MSRVFRTFLLCTLLTACAATPTAQFYALENTGAALVGDRFDRVLSIGPIDVPEYLDRPQMVTRAEGNRLVVDEFNRWGGPLAEEVSRVLTGHLAAVLGSQRVYGYPSRIAADADFRFAIDIRRFDGVPGGDVVLDVAWSVIDERTLAVIETRSTSYRDPWSGAGYGAYAASMSRLIGRLGDDLADSLSRL
ncbi:MAG: membrane integrity-associated transporter subunit PqiC [Gammaproteobacteria bacterium]|nr:membrane integrity-associated transporter subunit PqiC [Gammaproteobacteria bacterium]